MPTGDLSGNLKQLVRELRAIRYTSAIDEVGLRVGDPVACLPLLHYTLLKFSKHVALAIANAGVQLLGKTDQRFVECTFKVARDLFSLRPVISPQQFLEQGFAERKILFLTDLVHACKALHNEEARKQRLAAASVQRQSVTTLAFDAGHAGDQGAGGPLAAARPASAPRPTAKASTSATGLLEERPSTGGQQRAGAQDGAQVQAVHSTAEPGHDAAHSHGNGVSGYGSAATARASESPSPNYHQQHPQQWSPTPHQQQEHKTKQHQHQQQRPAAQQWSTMHPTDLLTQPSPHQLPPAWAGPPVSPSAQLTDLHGGCYGIGTRTSAGANTAGGQPGLRDTFTSYPAPWEAPTSAPPAAISRPDAASVPSTVSCPPSEWSAGSLPTDEMCAAGAAVPYAGAPWHADDQLQAAAVAASAPEDPCPAFTSKDGHPGGPAMGTAGAGAWLAAEPAPAAQPGAVLQLSAAPGRAGSGPQAASPEVVQQLLQRLAAVELESKQWRAQALAEQVALQARVTILEGKVRFLESNAASSAASPAPVEARHDKPAQPHANRHTEVAPQIPASTDHAPHPGLATQHSYARPDTHDSFRTDQDATTSFAGSRQGLPASTNGGVAARPAAVGAATEGPAATRSAGKLPQEVAYGARLPLHLPDKVLSEALGPRVTHSYAETVSLISTLASRYQEADHLLAQLNSRQR